VRKGTPKAKILAVLWWEIGKNKDEWRGMIYNTNKATLNK